MFKRFSTNYMTLLFLLDVIVIQLCLWGAMQLRYVLPFGMELLKTWGPQIVYAPTWGLHIAVGLIWTGSYVINSVYNPRKMMRWFDEAQRILLAHTVATLSLSGLMYMAQIDLPRLAYLYFYLGSLVVLLSYRLLLRSWHRYRRETSTSVARILIVGAGKTGCEIVTEFQRQQWPAIDFVGFLDDSSQKQNTRILGLPVLGKIDDVTNIIRRQQIDEIIIALPANAHHRVVNLVAAVHEFPVSVRVVPDYFSLAFFGATVESLGGIPLIGLRDPAIDDFQRFIKRLFDMLFSAFSLLLLSPLLIVVAIAIKLEDGGPIFYRAERAGENGRLFKMIKFRSMFVNADKLQSKINRLDESGTLIHKTANDPRVTRIGAFIRRTSIDELPQLLNVLRGEMSLVGPRPELPWMVDKYEAWQRKRFAVPQGITGWWQVNGRSDNPMHLHTDQDLYYIQNYSLWLDIQILWRTVGAVFRGKGAY
jgi:exopolysaccharide biosynthesis polyprenyl glycosylphosphotransferase